MIDSKVDVGAMRQRLLYQEVAGSLDEMNEPVQTWPTLGTFYASIEPLRGFELSNARQLKATTSHKVCMRNVNSALPFGIRPTGRFQLENTTRIFGIDQVFRVEEVNAYLSIHCSEMVLPQ